VRKRPERGLAELERWFQEAVVRPQERPRRASPRIEPASAWIRPSAHHSAAERIAIYSRMYHARMRDALAVDFPAVERLLGADGFERLVRLYLGAHPSRHYSLNALGRSLPSFLDGPVRIARRRLLADVARVELAIAEAFDEERCEPIGPADVARVPAGAWERARPVLVPALRLVACEHRAEAVVTAARRGEALPPLGRRPSWVVVWRKGEVVWRLEIEQADFAALSALRDGATLGEALEAAAAVHRGTPEELVALVRRGFAGWTSEGFFARVDV